MKEISAGGVVFYNDNQSTKLLLIEDKCRKWTLPKGKIEPGETYQETAIREIEEETGIIGEIVKPLDKVFYEYYHPIHNKIEKEVYFYLVEASSDKIKVQIDEINTAEWVTLEEAWKRQVNAGYDNNYDVIKKALIELGFNHF